MLAGFALFFSLAQLLPLAYALFEERDRADNIIPIAGFSASLAVGVCAALLLWLAGRSYKGHFFRREGIATVGLAWLLASLLGAIPYVWSGAITGWVDAVFETVSGLTTTGATVLGSGGNLTIEELPDSILLWRSFTQWIGGIGIVMVFVTLLPAMGITGKSLIASEQIGVTQEGVQPRMLSKARFLFFIYGVLTILCGLLLMWPGGMGLFDAVNHAMTCVSTAGFSTRNESIKAFDSVPVEVVMVVFMFIASCNFALLTTVVQRGPREILRDTEFRVYVGIIFTAIGAVTIALMAESGRDFLDALRGASFNVISVTTSTGYATEDFQQWPLPPITVMLGAMIVGGCTGSTAGGLKVIRLVIVCKLVAYTVRHYLRPKSVERIKVMGQPLSASVISLILALVLMWFVGLFLGTVVIALDQRLPFLSAVSTATSMLSCFGPSICDVDSTFRSLGPDLGPMGGYGSLYTPTKLFMAFLMLLGRLEFLAVLALLAPSFWRRS